MCPADFEVTRRHRQPGKGYEDLLAREGQADIESLGIQQGNASESTKAVPLKGLIGT